MIAKYMPKRVGASTNPCCLTPLLIWRELKMNLQTGLLPLCLWEMTRSRTDVWWASNSRENFEQTITADKVKSFCQIYEGYVEWLILIPAFLLEMWKGEYHVDSGAFRHEAALRYRICPLSKFHETTREHNGQHRDSSVVVAFAAIAFVLDDVTVSHVLENFPKESTLCTLDDFCRNSFQVWCFTCGQSVYGFAELLKARHFI